jgi:hypothetical protein
MKWITRERPKIDRIACPWLILRFIDKDAEFLYVPVKDVMETAHKTGAIPYDVVGVELTHDGELCSVRGADTSRLGLAPQAAGLYAMSLGLSALFDDDKEMLKHGMVVYEALYTWCRTCQEETHNWPPERNAVR